MIKLALALRRSSAERFATELGVHDYVREHSELEIICNKGRYAISWDEALSSEADGLIGYFHQPSHLKRVLDLGIPAVAINSIFNHTEVSCVRSNSHAVGVMAAEYFLKLDCSSFVFITDSTDHHYSTQRQAGFCEHLKKNNFEADCITSQSMEPARLWLQKKIVNKERTAVFCVNDRIAREVLNQLEIGHPNLEDYIIVLGVDNDPFYYESGNIIFSSICVNHRHIGYLAAQQAHKHCLDHQLPASCTEVPPLKLHNRHHLARKMQTQHPAIELIFKKIKADYNDPALNASVIASHCGLSVRSLNRILKENAYPPLASNILQARIRIAKELLQRSNLSLEQIAYTVGFNEYSTFFRSFKKIVGSAPSDFH